MAASTADRRATITKIAVLALLAALCWFGWLGWDSEYQTDEAGIVSGPYEAWQVIGAAASLVVVVVIGTTMLGATRTVVTVSVVFASCWAATQAARDSTGLWLVGALLTLIGVAAGASVVALVTVAVSRTRRRGPQP